MLQIYSNQMWVASEVEGSFVRLNPLPLESDSISQQISVRTETPEGVWELTIGMGKPPHTHWNWVQEPFHEATQIFFFFLFFFCLFRATHATYGGFQLGVISQLQLPAYITAHGNARSLTHWASPGTEPPSSWIPVGFVTTEPQQELLRFSIVIFLSPSRTLSVSSKLLKLRK